LIGDYVMDKYDFIKMILKRRDVSVNDKKRGILLATQELEQKAPISNRDGKTLGKNKKEQKHVPKDTASFLSLFEERDAFKYLTHDFDSNSEVNYGIFLSQVREKFKEATKRFTIPPSLYATMDVFLNGGVDNGKPRTWTAWNGINYKENYASLSWMEWIKENPGKHLTRNTQFNEVIMAFRCTTRLIKPALEKIIDREKEKYQNLCITTHHLDNADFYTNVRCLIQGIERILDDMSKYEGFNNIDISFSRDYDSEPAKMIIKITQVGSEAHNIEEVVKRFKSGAGAFNEMAKDFSGYCNWSVEALWDGQPKRWNILKDDGDILEIEDTDRNNINGFTHILTYFKKI